MPKDSSIKSVLIIGSGPIIIGQACEFDYSGTQAARSLREEGIKVILINSNPATIMTDPMMADKVYLLPLTAESIEQILEENQIDAVLPTMGGQTALNLAKEAEDLGLWEKFGVRLIGVDIKAIDKAEDREKFRQWMIQLGVSVAQAKNCQFVSRRKRICPGNRIPSRNPPFFHAWWYWWRICSW
jgi:carbamoyl-phosphate synthase large subunit